MFDFEKFRKAPYGKQLEKIEEALSCMGERELKLVKDVWNSHMKNRNPEFGAELDISEKDWVEIYYALDFKLNAVKEGHYGSDSEDKNWSIHLSEILSKLGPDGTEAARRGISPV